MDGFSSATTNKEKGIVIIGATNRVSLLSDVERNLSSSSHQPFDIDPAILRRLPRRMMIGLPDKKERESKS